MSLSSISKLAGVLQGSMTSSNVNRYWLETCPLIFAKASNNFRNGSACKQTPQNQTVSSVSEFWPRVLNENKDISQRRLDVTCPFLNTTWPKSFLITTLETWFQILIVNKYHGVSKRQVECIGHLFQNKRASCKSNLIPHSYQSTPSLLAWPALLSILDSALHDPFQAFQDYKVHRIVEFHTFFML